jgi:hypothetical protein
MADRSAVITQGGFVSVQTPLRERNIRFATVTDKAACGGATPILYSDAAWCAR